MYLQVVLAVTAFKEIRVFQIIKMYFMHTSLPQTRALNPAPIQHLLRCRMHQPQRLQLPQLLLARIPMSHYKAMQLQVM